MDFYSIRFKREDIDTMVISGEDIFTGILDSYNLSDDLDFNGDLTLNLIFGVDNAGFYIDETSFINLDIELEGNLIFDTEFLGVSDVIETFLSGSIEVALSFNDQANRYRISDLDHLDTSLTTSLSGGLEAISQFSTQTSKFDYSLSHTLSNISEGLNQVQSNQDLAWTLFLPTQSNDLQAVSSIGEYLNDEMKWAFEFDYDSNVSRE